MLKSEHCLILLLLSNMIRLVLISKADKEKRMLDEFKNDLYCFHGKKSFLDSYGGMRSINKLYMFLSIPIYLTVFLYNFLNIYNAFALSFYVALVYGLDYIYAIYLFTEVKHLSPNDLIGRKIYDSKNNLDMIRFYRRTSLYGLLWYAVSFFQCFVISHLSPILVFILTIFLLFFGMADVLQHDNYNTTKGSLLFVKSKWYKRIYLDRIMRFCINKNFRNIHYSTFKYNFSNICSAIKQLSNYKY